jgi:hypothetical protein
LPGEEEHTTDHHLRLLRQTGKYPVLVLNTDAQPLSYLPLSIIRWQEVCGLKGEGASEGGREGGAFSSVFSRKRRFTF